MKHILCMGRARSVPGPGQSCPLPGSGPCKGYVSYMYVHDILYDRGRCDIMLYHPMLPLRSEPILFSLVTPILSSCGDPILFCGGDPQVTAHGHFPTSSLGGTSSHTWVVGSWAAAKRSYFWGHLGQHLQRAVCLDGEEQENKVECELWSVRIGPS